MNVNQNRNYRKNFNMSRISIPTVEQSPDAAKPLLAAVQKQLGMVPNMMKLVGHSPAALEGYLSLNGALAKGKLDAKLRERIALVLGVDVDQVNVKAKTAEKMGPVGEGLAMEVRAVVLLL